MPSSSVLSISASDQVLNLWSGESSRMEKQMVESVTLIAVDHEGGLKGNGRKNGCKFSFLGEEVINMNRDRRVWQDSDRRPSTSGQSDGRVKDLLHQVYQSTRKRRRRVFDEKRTHDEASSCGSRRMDSGLHKIGSGLHFGPESEKSQKRTIAKESNPKREQRPKREQSQKRTIPKEKNESINNQRRC